MSKVGLTFASLLLTGSLVGLGFSSYYVANADKMADRFLQEYASSPTGKIAYAYGSAANELYEAVGNMGSYVITDNEVLKINASDKDDTIENLEEAVEDLSEAENSEQYIEQIEEIKNEFSVIDAEYEGNIPKIMDFKNELELLNHEFLIYAIETDPNYLSIETRIKKFEESKDTCIFPGIFFSCLLVIASGLWAVSETSDYLPVYPSYSRRKRNKP